mmetsp:Transcript_5315/g.15846  ORF Transcript_5315/g.15846 Transcript_5315/m.15846 type:complete len:201 (-) Transcript_5315:78-680(-)
MIAPEAVMSAAMGINHRNNRKDPRRFARNATIMAPGTMPSSGGRVVSTDTSCSCSNMPCIFSPSAMPFAGIRPKFSRKYWDPRSKTTSPEKKSSTPAMYNRRILGKSPIIFSSCTKGKSRKKRRARAKARPSAGAAAGRGPSAGRSSPSSASGRAAASRAWASEPLAQSTLAAHGDTCGEDILGEDAASVGMRTRYTSTK